MRKSDMEKIENFAKIERFIESLSGKINRDQIVYNVTKYSAMGERTINNRIDLLISINKVSEKEGALFWNKEEDIKSKGE